MYPNTMSKQDSVDRDRQARILFYSATFAAALSAAVTLFGAGEIVIGNPHGNATMMGGLHTSIQSIRLAKSACDRVKQLPDRSTK
jgi:7-keto-8-aminopelargonate synthetase-like enzyme